MSLSVNVSPQSQTGRESKFSYNVKIIEVKALSGAPETINGQGTLD